MVNRFFLCQLAQVSLTSGKVDSLGEAGSTQNKNSVNCASDSPPISAVVDKPLYQSPDIPSGQLRLIAESKTNLGAEA
jgi:hypothetical protein